MTRASPTQPPPTNPTTTTTLAQWMTTTMMELSISSRYHIHTAMVICYHKGLYPWQSDGFAWMLQFWKAGLNLSCYRRRMFFTKLHSMKICLNVNPWFPSHWSYNGGWNLLFILNECVKRVWPIRRRLIITSYFSLFISSMMACNLLHTCLFHRSCHKDEINGWIFIQNIGTWKFKIHRLCFW